MTDHSSCAKHISLANGVCYCERDFTVYVYPWDVVPGPRGRVEEIPADLDFFDAVIIQVRRSWPGKLIRGFTLLGRGRLVHGLRMDGLNPDELPDWRAAEKRA